MASFDLNRALLESYPDLAALLKDISTAVPGYAWVVGGFVRDIVIGRRPLDIDLAATSRVEPAARRIAGVVGGSLFALDEARQTYRVALPDGRPVRTIDIAALRAATIEADLAERDFTVNAMAAPLTAAGFGPIIDPTGGLEDTRSGLLRMVSERALSDDPLRGLRAARLATELTFEIEPDTSDAIRRSAVLLAEVAGERQRDELFRILEAPRSSGGLRLLDSLGLLDVLFPELVAARGVTQPVSFHYYDVFDHSIEAVAVTDWLLSDVEPEGDKPREMRAAFWDLLGSFGLADYFAGAAGGQSRLALTRLATLLHDVSKPETKTVEDDGRVRFLGHPEAGARVAREVCRRLRLGQRESHFVSILVEEHLRPAQLSQSGAPTDRAIFRFFRALGEAAPACLVLSLADAASAIGPRLEASRWRAHLAYIGYVLRKGESQTAILGGATATGQDGSFEWGKRGRHFVSGDTLIRALALSPGPVVGDLLAAIDEAAASGDLRTEEEAIQLARTLHAGGSNSKEAGVA